MLFMDDGGEGDEAPRALVVMAHPDDAEIGCMGTMLALRAHGWAVHLLIVATGEHGVSVDDRDAGQGSFHESLRYRESLRAFEGTGIMIESLMRVDGALQVSRELISDIERKLRAFEPRVVITHYADSSGMDHQDHGAVARATLNATIRRRSVRCVLHSEPHLSRTAFRPDVFVDITPHVQRKREALACHESQAGRVYLSDAYHTARELRHAHRAGTWFMEEDRRFEAFQSALLVVS